MAYNYLDLTNEVISRFNEVPLTSATFSSSRGVQTQCKTAVNETIRYIDSMEYNWPFNHASHQETLVAGTTRYTIPANAKHVNYETFRLAKDDSLNCPGGSLSILDYNEYIDRFIDQEDEAGIGSIPRQIIRTPDNNFALYPYPNQAYTLRYDYYTYTTELDLYSDVPAIPAQYRNVIVDGATAFVYQYRGEAQLYAINFDRFQNGVKQMQSIILNRYDYIRSTVIDNNRRGSYAY